MRRRSVSESFRASSWDMGWLLFEREIIQQFELDALAHEFVDKCSVQERVR